MKSFIIFPRNGMPADRVWRDTHSFDWGPLDVPDHEFRDSQNVAWAIDRLKVTRENHIEERDSEASEYPHVVAEIKEWLKENPGQGKRIVIPQ